MVRSDSGKLLCAQARAELGAGHRDLATGLIGDAQGLADNLRSDGGSALSREIDEVRKLI
ncbi:MAG TPA: hypothetical protein VH041_15355 [Caldimonas sp.]|nr:hypothetical protein [Caldimonas sp.]HEX4235669.1 hypothetical protein [Caldimonas sp.]